MAPSIGTPPPLQTAQILQFPFRERMAALSTREQRFAAMEAKARRFAGVEGGSGWYHDAALAEERRDEH